MAPPAIQAAKLLVEPGSIDWASVSHPQRAGWWSRAAASPRAAHVYDVQKLEPGSRFVDTVEMPPVLRVPSRSPPGPMQRPKRSHRPREHVHTACVMRPP